MKPLHLKGQTMHARRGVTQNHFRYGVDYVLLDPDARKGPFLFSRNGWNLAAVHDHDHGGAPNEGRGAQWAKEVFLTAGLTGSYQIRLLTQPAFLGYIFNPVSFWLAQDAGGLRAVIAEVNNTYGDRHSYLCHLPDFAPIKMSDRITAQKIFHVSPFQEIAGQYHFNFDITDERIAIRILLENGDEGVIATLQGVLVPLSNFGLITAFMRRPLGALRTSALIYWQALKLKSKGVMFRPRPLPPKEELSS